MGFPPSGGNGNGENKPTWHQQGHNWMEVDPENDLCGNTWLHDGSVLTWKDGNLWISRDSSEAAKKDMGRMLDYIDKLGELNTDGIEPMSHVFPVQNVWREDVVTNGDDRDNIIKNAPDEKDGMFEVPKTFG